eukprot:EG_transcript_37386
MQPVSIGYYEVSWAVEGSENTGKNGRKKYAGQKMRELDGARGCKDMHVVVRRRGGSGHSGQDPTNPPNNGCDLMQKIQRGQMCRFPGAVEGPRGFMKLSAAGLNHTVGHLGGNQGQKSKSGEVALSNGSEGSRARFGALQRGKIA